MKRHRGFIMAVALGVAACGSEPAVPPRILCDGGGGIRLGFEIVVNPTQRAYGESVIFDNGSSFLFVDGDCHFFLREPGNGWDDTFTGDLSAEESKQLSADLGYSGWPMLDDTYGANGPLLDASLTVFFDDTKTIVCARGCQDDVPEEVRAMRAKAFDWNAKLKKVGSPVDGPLRVILAPLGSAEMFSSADQVADWTLSTPIAEMAVQRSDPSIYDYGSGRLLKDPDDVAKLRELRRAYRDGEHGPFNGYIPIRDPAGSLPGYRGYVRDVMSVEDAQGLVPIP